MAKRGQSDRPPSPPGNDSEQVKQKATFERLKGWAVGLTGVLVVVPALVNSGFDVYAALAKLPKTDAEKINDEMFRKYFNKQPVAAFPVPVQRDAALVNASFSIYDGGDIYVEFGKRSQWFQFPHIEKVSLQAPFSIIGTATAGESASLDGAGQFQQSDRLHGDKIIRERRWENGVLETFVIDPRTGRITDRRLQRLSLPDGKTPISDTNPVQTNWLQRVDQEKIGPLTIQRFRDSVYFLAMSVVWQSSSVDVSLPSATVPRGFVTEFSSMPRMFWAVLRPDGAYAYAAVVHDYLYWTQSTDRETADKIFRECLLELNVSESTVAALYGAVRVFGDSVWSANAELKKAGEQRVLTRFPDSPSVTWAEWKKRPDVFQ